MMIYLHWQTSLQNRQCHALSKLSEQITILLNNEELLPVQILFVLQVPFA